MLQYDRMKETKGFLLKTYLENHAHQHISMPIKIVTEAIKKENMQDQRKLKIATLTISVYTSRLMCLKIES